MEVFDILDFSIPAESTTSKIIIRSSDFKDILSDIDNTSDYVEFTFSEEPPFFKISTSGIAGKCSVSFFLYLLYIFKLNYNFFRWKYLRKVI